jgi:ABC-type lipopolysaccharide export system ATPase subunit
VPHEPAPASSQRPEEVLWRHPGRRRRVLRGAPGEIFGVIGPNGSGKTTLFNSMLGQIAPDAGQILLHGQDVSRLGPLA